MSPVLCAQCGKPQDVAFRPFCCKRCADLDLHRWLSGRYIIAASPDGEEEDETGLAGGQTDPLVP